MTLQDFLISRIGITVGLALSRLPRQLGYPVAALLASLISRRKNNPAVKAVRANQWVLGDQKLSNEELDRRVYLTYQSTARSLYEFWHNLRDKNTVLNLVKFRPSFFQTIQDAQAAGRGLILVIAHMANFDLIGHAAAMSGVPLHILSYPQPPGGYRWQNRIRELPNLQVTPMSVESIRLASETLHEKKIVATGIDRPLPDGTSKYPIRFFNLPAYLPVFHIRLALKLDVPIAVVGNLREKDGTYSVWASQPIVMEKRPDLVEETVTNAEKITGIVETNIMKAPEQWAMFYPVWPEVMEKVPY